MGLRDEIEEILSEKKANAVDKVVASFAPEEREEVRAIIEDRAIPASVVVRWLKRRDIVLGERTIHSHRSKLSG